MGNEIATLESVFDKIDTITTNLPQVSGGSFRHTFALAKAITDMEVLFENPDIKAAVIAMQGSPLGFLTDRDNFGEPYAWGIVKRAAIQAMLERYRLSGNEWNLIGSRFMPVKCGKFRHIIEFPGLSNFNPTTTSATFVFEERADRYGKKIEICTAKVKCFATWIIDGEKYSIGFGDDQLVFKIKVNKGMGDDAVIGKALSKLFGRVLMRLKGVSIPEVDDIIDDDQAADAMSGIVSDGDVPENLKSANPDPKQNDYPAKNQKTKPVEDQKTVVEKPDAEKKAFVPCVCGKGVGFCGEYDLSVPTHCGVPGNHSKTSLWLFPKDAVVSRCEDFRQYKYTEIKNLDKSQLAQAKEDMGIEVAKTQSEQWAVYCRYYGMSVAAIREIFGLGEVKS